jgi:hypothetical protein
MCSMRYYVSTAVCCDLNGTILGSLSGLRQQDDEGNTCYDLLATEAFGHLPAHSEPRYQRT